MPILALTTVSKEASPTNGGGSAIIEVSKRTRSETIVDVARMVALAEKSE
jgi:hypothetical protein